MQPPKRVGLGDPSPLKPKSQGYHSMAANGGNGRSAGRRRHSEPVTSADRAEEYDTRGPGMETMSTAAQLQEHSPQTMQLPIMASTPMNHNLSRDIEFTMTTFLELDGSQIAYCFTHATEQPPITSDSLAELDMPRIINNPKLRYDVNFDRDLHFRPNVDGSKGREKSRLADEFWKALEGELFMYGYVYRQRSQPHQSQKEAYWQNILRLSRRRLPNVFTAIKEVLTTLVPDYDQQAVVDRLDVDLLMQQVENGVCDLVELADWFARILKNHCAPMRDSMVDRMQTEIKQGAIEERPGMLVNGIRHLLNILEAMKLDVANHQIRHMRPLLVEDTVNFQRRYNAHRISINKIDVPRSRLWLEYEMAYLSNENDSINHVEALTSALLRGLFWNESASLYPQTFYLDAERLRGMRIELHSRVYQEVCRDTLFEMASPGVPTSAIFKAATELHTSITAIVGTSGRFMDRLDNIAAEIMRILLKLEGDYQVFDATLLSHIEQRLHFDLHRSSAPFEMHAQTLFESLLPRLQSNIGQYLRLSALQLQDRFVPQVSVPPQQLGMGAVCGVPEASSTQADTDEDIIRRLTHMVVLHWQVWADLVYLTVPEDDRYSSDSSNHPTPPSSASVSPTIPVAQAVYAPGRKWLPIGITVTEVPSGFPTPVPSPAPQPSDDQSTTPKANRKTSDSSTTSEQSPVDRERQQPA